MVALKSYVGWETQKIRFTFVHNPSMAFDGPVELAYLRLTRSLGFSYFCTYKFLAFIARRSLGKGNIYSRYLHFCSEILTLTFNWRYIHVDVWRAA